jgi:predicted AAA+ superfamily ATPase
VLVPRASYIEQIAPFIGQPFVKVITGVRRSGKSSLLGLIEAELRARGVPERQILRLDFEDLGIAHLATAAALHEHVEHTLPGGEPSYLLLDEIQEVAGWERAVNSLHARGVDIYLTGSNSRLLSSELATYIAGRYVAFEVWPLSFAEYGDFRAQISGWPDLTAAQQFDDYIERGGFPGLAALDLAVENATTALRDIYSSVLLRDTLQRHRLRQPELLQRVAAFVLDNIGNPFSANAIARFLKSQRRPADPETVHTYLAALEEAFLVARVPRYDLRGKELLRTSEKYYVADHALVPAVLGGSPTRLPGILENIVWAELRRRGYEVRVGKTGSQEVDFVAERAGERHYVQVAYLIAGSAQTWERETAPLLAIRDNHPKCVVSLDPHAGAGERGIGHFRAPDWLLGDSF